MSAPDVMSLLEARLEALASLHPKVIDLSLTRILRLLEDLGRPQDKLPPVVHVAGTNGKGSTIAFLRAMLEAKGHSVHVYTSPHLVRFNERIRLAQKPSGVLVDDATLLAAIDHCLAVNKDAPITVFEFTTAVALWLFANQPADFLLLEVGLGGRFDTTNVIAKTLVSVITPISFDHQDFLGNTLEKIAGEKAGIIKPGVPVVSAAQEPEVQRVLEREARAVNAGPVFLASRDYHVRAEQGRLLYEDDSALFDLPLPRLIGAHQIENAGTAIAALKFITAIRNQAHIATGLSQAQWPARLQNLGRGRLIDRLPKGTELWLDGGHNAEGGRVLAAAMGDMAEQHNRPLVLICGTLANKDTSAFLKPFKGLAHSVLGVAIPDAPATRTPLEIAALAYDQGLPAAACNSVAEALDFISALDWQQAPRVLIAGSLYLAGHVLKEDGTPVV